MAYDPTKDEAQLIATKDSEYLYYNPVQGEFFYQPSLEKKVQKLGKKKGVDALPQVQAFLGQDDVEIMQGYTPVEFTSSSMADPENLKQVDGLFPPQSDASSTFMDQLLLQDPDDLSATSTPVEAKVVDPTTSQSARKEALRGQAGRLTVGFGAGLLTDAFGAGLSQQKTSLDKIAEERIEEKQRQQREGEDGLTPEEKKLLVRSTLGPVGALTREQRLRREAEQDASGVQRSAADLQRARDTETRAMAEAAGQAGMTLAQADLQRKEQLAQELDQLFQFQAQSQNLKRAQLMRQLNSLSQGFALLGAEMSGFNRGLTNNIYAAGAQSGVLLSDNDVNDLRIAFSRPGMTEERAKRLLRAKGVDPNKVNMNLLLRT